MSVLTVQRNQQRKKSRAVRKNKKVDRSTWNLGVQERKQSKRLIVSCIRGWTLRKDKITLSIIDCLGNEIELERMCSMLT